MRRVLISLFLSLFALPLFAQGYPACKDPWITAALKSLGKGGPSDTGNNGLCNITRYHAGKWSNQGELNDLVKQSFLCDDPWIGEVYAEAALGYSKPKGSGSTGECSAALYGGRWNGYDDLRSKIIAYRNSPPPPPPQPKPAPVAPPPTGPNCRDPWITNALRMLGRGTASDTGDNGLCNVNRYHAGKWSNQGELNDLVKQSFLCDDPWIGQVYAEAALGYSKPAGNGSSGECSAALYGGRWNGYDDLRSKIIAYKAPKPAPAPTPAPPPPPAPVPQPAPAPAPVATGPNCRDPWITNALKALGKGSVADSGDNGLCSPNRYHAGKWSNQGELNDLVKQSFLCNDPWIGEVYAEPAMGFAKPQGSGASGECSPSLYGGGQWNGYADLESKIIAYKKAKTSPQPGAAPPASAPAPPPVPTGPAIRQLHEYAPGNTRAMFIIDDRGTGWHFDPKAVKASDSGSMKRLTMPDGSTLSLDLQAMAIQGGGRVIAVGAGDVIAASDGTHRPAPGAVVAQDAASMTRIAMQMLPKAPPVAPPAPTPAPSPTPTPAPAPVPAQPGTVTIRANPSQLILAPGERATVSVTIATTGPVPSSIPLRVTGAPHIQIDRDAFNIGAGASHDVVVTALADANPNGETAISVYADPSGLQGASARKADVRISFKPAPAVTQPPVQTPVVRGYSAPTPPKSTPPQSRVTIKVIPSRLILAPGEQSTVTISVTPEKSGVVTQRIPLHITGAPGIRLGTDSFDISPNSMREIGVAAESNAPPGSERSLQVWADPADPELLPSDKATFSVLFKAVAVTATSGGPTCTDPGITAALVALKTWSSADTGTNGLCNPNRYRQGKWGNQGELNDLVRQSMLCDDPWIGEVYAESDLGFSKPNGSGSSGECRAGLYGSWSSYADLKAKILDYKHPKLAMRFPGSTGMLKNAATGQCLTPKGSGDGASMSFSLCESYQFETFTYGPNGELKVNDKCLVLQNGSTNDGTPIIEWTCSNTGQSNELWSLDESNHLIARDSRKCMEADSSGAVVLRPCGSGAAQQWTLEKLVPDDFTFTGTPTSLTLSVGEEKFVELHADAVGAAKDAQKEGEWLVLQATGANGLVQTEADLSPGGAIRIKEGRRMYSGTEPHYRFAGVKPGTTTIHLTATHPMTYVTHSLDVNVTVLDNVKRGTWTSEVIPGVVGEEPDTPMSFQPPPSLPPPMTLVGASSLPIFQQIQQRWAGMEGMSIAIAKTRDYLDPDQADQLMAFSQAYDALLASVRASAPLNASGPSYPVLPPYRAVREPHYEVASMMPVFFSLTDVRDPESQEMMKDWNAGRRAEWQNIVTNRQPVEVLIDQLRMANYTIKSNANLTIATEALKEINDKLDAMHMEQLPIPQLRILVKTLAVSGSVATLLDIMGQAQSNLLVSHVEDIYSTVDDYNKVKGGANPRVAVNAKSSLKIYMTASSRGGAVLRPSQVVDLIAKPLWDKVKDKLHEKAGQAAGYTEEKAMEDTILDEVMTYLGKIPGLSQYAQKLDVPFTVKPHKTKPILINSERILTIAPKEDEPLRLDDRSNLLIDFGIVPGTIGHYYIEGKHATAPGKTAGYGYGLKRWLITELGESTAGQRLYKKGVVEVVDANRKCSLGNPGDKCFTLTDDKKYPAGGIAFGYAGSGIVTNDCTCVQASGRN